LINSNIRCQKKKKKHGHYKILTRVWNVFCAMNLFVTEIDSRLRLTRTRLYYIETYFLQQTFRATRRRRDSRPVGAIDFPAPEPGPNYLTTFERIKNCLQTSLQLRCIYKYIPTYIIHIIVILYVYCVRMVWFWFYWQHYAAFYVDFAWFFYKR